MKGKRFFSVLMGACLAGGMLFASACGGNKGKVGVLRIDAFEGGGGGTYARAGGRLSQIQSRSGW